LNPVFLLVFFDYRTALGCRPAAVLACWRCAAKTPTDRHACNDPGWNRTRAPPRTTVVLLDVTQAPSPLDHGIDVFRFCGRSGIRTHKITGLSTRPLFQFAYSTMRRALAPQVAGPGVAPGVLSLWGSAGHWPTCVAKNLSDQGETRTPTPFFCWHDVLSVACLPFHHLVMLVWRS
jgi:hypothetical protein